MDSDHHSSSDTSSSVTSRSRLSVAELAAKSLRIHIAPLSSHVLSESALSRKWSATVAAFRSFAGLLQLVQLLCVAVFGFSNYTESEPLSQWIRVADHILLLSPYGTVTTHGGFVVLLFLLHACFLVVIVWTLARSFTFMVGRASLLFRILAAYAELTAALSITMVRHCLLFWQCNYEEEMLSIFPSVACGSSTVAAYVTLGVLTVLMILPICIWHSSALQPCPALIGIHSMDIFAVLHAGATLPLRLLPLLLLIVIALLPVPFLSSIIAIAVFGLLWRQVSLKRFPFLYQIVNVSFAAVVFSGVGASCAMFILSWVSSGQRQNAAFPLSFVFMCVTLIVGAVHCKHRFEGTVTRFARVLKISKEELLSSTCIPCWDASQFDRSAAVEDGSISPTPTWVESVESQFSNHHSSSFSHVSAALFWRLACSSGSNALFLCRILLLRGVTEERLKSVFSILERVLANPRFSESSSVWLVYCAMRDFVRSDVETVTETFKSSEGPSPAIPNGVEPELADLTGWAKKASNGSTSSAGNIGVRSLPGVFRTLTLDERLSRKALQQFATSPTLSLTKQFFSSLWFHRLTSERSTTLLFEPQAEHQRCKKRIRAFWACLLSDHTELSSLPRFVSSVQRHSEKGEALFEGLMRRFPNDPDVQTANARFEWEVNCIQDSGRGFVPSGPPSASLRLNAWRSALANRKDSSLSRLWWSIMISVIVLGVCVIVAFSMLAFMLGSFSSGGKYIHNVGRARRLSQSCSTFIRSATLDSSTSLAFRTRAYLAAEEMKQQLVYAQEKTVPSSETRRQIMNGLSYPRYYVPQTDSYDVSRSLTRHDYLAVFAEKVRTVSSTDLVASNVTFNTDVRFVFDNGFVGVMNTAVDMTDHLRDMFVFQHSVFVFVLFLLFAFIWIVPLILYFLIVRPSACRFDEERVRLFALFTSVPKGMVHQLSAITRRSSDADQMAAPDNASASDSERDEPEFSPTALRLRAAAPFHLRSDPLRRLKIRFLFVALLAALAATLFFALSFSYSTNIFEPVSSRTSSAGLRRAFSHRLRALSVEIAANDRRTWSSRDAVRDEIVLQSKNLNEMDIAMRKDSDGQYEPLDSLHYEWTCSNTSDFACKPLTLQLQSFMDTVLQWRSVPDAAVSLSHPILKQVIDMDDILVDRLELSVSMQAGAYDSTVTLYLTVASVCFALLLPMLLFSFLSLLSLVSQLRDNDFRSRMMFLLLPVSWLQTWALLPMILYDDRIEDDDADDRVTVHDGSMTLKLSKMQLMERYDNLQNRYRRLLDTSSDGVVELVLTKTGNATESSDKDCAVCIENFNDSFGKLFTIPSAHLRGRPFSSLAATAEDAQLIHEAFKPGSLTMHIDVSLFRGSDRTSFPVRLDVSRVFARAMLDSKDASSDPDIVKDDEAIIVFVRDLTEQVNRERMLDAEKRRSEALLLNMMPAPIVRRLQNGEFPIADFMEDVTIFFSDIRGFTELSSLLSPSHLVRVLHTLVTGMDRLANHFGVTKIKIVADGYLAVTGAPRRTPDHSLRMVEFAFATLDLVNRLNSSGVLDLPKPIELRIGIHTGRIVAGCIGESRCTWDVYSDDVNVASRLETTGIPGRVHVSEATLLQVHEAHEHELRENVELKGMGKWTTYLLGRRKEGAPSAVTEPVDWEYIMDISNTRPANGLFGRGGEDSAAPLTASVLRARRAKSVSLAGFPS